MSIPDSKNKVLSTKGLVIAEYLKKLQEEMPEIKRVFDPQLSFESSLKLLRDNNNLESTTTDCYPLFSFRPSIIRHVEAGCGRRATSFRPTRRNGEDVGIYRTIHGEFDIEFQYFTKLERDLEQLEIAYMAQESFSEHQTLELDLTAEIGGPLKYFLWAKDLEDKTIESNGLYYKAVSGRIVVRGFHLVFRNETKAAQGIVLRILDCNNTLYTQKTLA